MINTSQRKHNSKRFGSCHSSRNLIIEVERDTFRISLAFSDIFTRSVQKVTRGTARAIQQFLGQNHGIPEQAFGYPGQFLCSPG